jgi:hypothetical protein
MGEERLMTLTKERKKELIGAHRRGTADTGSAEIQIALLTGRISHLTEHFKKHTKDFDPEVVAAPGSSRCLDRSPSVDGVDWCGPWARTEEAVRSFVAPGHFNGMSVGWRSIFSPRSSARRSGHEGKEGKQN